MSSLTSDKQSFASPDGEDDKQPPPSKEFEYTVVEMEDYRLPFKKNIFNKKVVNLMKQGWKLQGGVCVVFCSNRGYKAYQAMIKN